MLTSASTRSSGRRRAWSFQASAIHHVQVRAAGRKVGSLQRDAQRAQVVARAKTAQPHFRACVESVHDRRPELCDVDSHREACLHKDSHGQARWSAHSRSSSHFLAVAEHRLLPSRARNVTTQLCGAGISSDVTPRGHAGVGVVCIHVAPLSLPAIGTPRE